MAENTSDADRRDEAGSERDQAAYSRDHDGDARDLAGAQRDQVSEERDALGNLRDIDGAQRDVDAAARDRHAELAHERDDPPSPIERDRAATARLEAASDRDAARRDRHAGANDRAESGEDRTTSLADRNAGAAHRTQAGLDRHISISDRGSSADERESAARDTLTGAYTRGAGLIELEREMARARRTGAPLAIAFVDIDHLKLVNDVQGHIAGDRLIARVAHALRSVLREYDLVIRYGGDEFLCVLQNLDMARAQTRVEEVNGALAGDAAGGTVAVGLAQLNPHDTIISFVDRADNEMYEGRRLRRGGEG